MTANLNLTALPDDFYPDEVIVVGKYKNAELAFAITKHTFRDGLVTAEYMRDNLNALRMLLWQDRERPDRDK